MRCLVIFANSHLLVFVCGSSWAQALYHQARNDPVSVQPDDVVHAGELLAQLGAQYEAAQVAKLCERPMA